MLASTISTRILTVLDLIWTCNASYTVHAWILGYPQFRLAKDSCTKYQMYKSGLKCFFSELSCAIH